MRIDAPRLRRVAGLTLEGLRPRRAFEACEALGGLARWWLRPEVLRTAQQYDGSFPALTNPSRPELSETPGSCWIVFVRDEERSETLPLLREAFLLPLTWQAQASHDPRLPATLREMADDIIRELQPRDGPWSLHLASEAAAGDPTLADDLHFHFASGWASLVGGLALRADSLTPRRTVWASGAWKDGQLAEIDGLEAKLALAVEWQAERFFVPAWLVGKGQEHLGSQGATGLTVEALTLPARGGVRPSLAGYLARLGNRPPPPDLDSPQGETALAVCTAYYLLLPARTAEARRFYWSHLLAGVIRKCQRQVPLACRPTHLVTVASDSPELVVLVARALRVRYVLQLHTEERKYLESAALAQQELTTPGREDAPVVTSAAFTYGPAMQDEMRRHLLGSLPSGLAPEQVAFDLTPGTKLMTLTLERLARQHHRNSWMIYVKHELVGGSPKGEEIVAWRAGEE